MKRGPIKGSRCLSQRSGGAAATGLNENRAQAILDAVSSTPHLRTCRRADRMQDSGPLGMSRWGLYAGVAARYGDGLVGEGRDVDRLCERAAR